MRRNEVPPLAREGLGVLPNELETAAITLMTCGSSVGPRMTTDFLLALFFEAFETQQLNCC